MAATVAFNAYLRDVIGLNTNDRVTRLRDQGLTEFDLLDEFDDDDVRTIIKSARTDSANPITISALIEKRIRTACYGAKIYTLVGRTVTGDSLSINRLKALALHKSVVEDHKDPSDDVPKVSKTFHISKALDMLPNYLRSCIGVRGVALSYVIRPDENSATLGALGPDLPYDQDSGSLMNELIIGVELVGAGWDEDNATVFSILQEMVKDSPMASSLKSHQRRRDGRGAYHSLVQHNLGSAQWDKTLQRAEDLQTTRIWNGRNSRYSLKRHVDTHRDSYNDMVRANEHVQYEVPNERTRVGRLLKSIHANHIASIAAAKTTIEATITMRENFESAADFLILNAPVIKNQSNDQRISALSSGNENNDDKTLDDYSHVQVEDRFYTPEQYGELNRDQRAKLRLLRLARGGNGKKQSKTKRRNQKRKNYLKKTKAENEELKQRIAALESNKENHDDDESDDEPPSKKVQFNQRTGQTENKRKGK